MTNNQKGILYAIITAFFWGFLAIFLKIAVQEVAPQTVVWFRFVVAFVMLAGWQLFKNPSSLKILIKPPKLLLFAAIGLSWNYMGYMLGIHYTSPSNAQVVIQTGPIILALAGVLFFKERLQKVQLIGFVVATIGFAFFYSQQIGQMIGQQGQYNMGVLFTFSGAIAWAIYAIFQKQLVVSNSSAGLNLFLFGFPAIVYIPFIDFAPLTEINWIWWLVLFFLGVNTLVAYSCLALALKYTQANKVSIIIIINPIITFVTMGILTKMNVSWIEGEHFPLLSILGAVIVLSGAALVVGKREKLKKQSTN
ncbi:DMT family transporter [uncultured Sunxiuqinia sp.]|uniref:DMT family transporter n=1 Tax=uncultured Sunxiuqinia sp. TaxID=1573825 RepID=UPI002AA601CE|nr:DMT family transporter [uncultured Sunxiuqinia sp.]